MRRFRVIAVTAAAVLAVGVVSLPAQAVAPIPAAAVPLPVALDNASFYEAQTVCDPTPRPGALALRDLLLADVRPGHRVHPTGVHLEDQ